MPDGPRAPGRGTLPRGGQRGQPGGVPRPGRRVAAPAGQQRPGSPGQIPGRAAGGLRGVPPGARLLADARVRGAGRAGRAAAGHRRRGGGPRPRPGPERARRALPLRQGEPGPQRPGRRPRASGTGPGPRPGAQRRDERARPDQAQAARHGRRDQALHQRRPGHPGGAHLQQEHRRGAAAHGVQDDLRVHADRADPDLDSRGHPRGPAAVRDRARHRGRAHRGLLRLRWCCGCRARRG